MDPKDILFSVPTLCDRTPETAKKPPSGDFCSVHEDDWRQIEFVAKSNLAHVQNELTALSVFKEQHRKGPGWNSVYIRKEHPTPLARLALQSSSLPLLCKKALVMGSTPPWVGTVPGGLVVSDGGDWFIYGHSAPDGQVLQLAVSPARTVLSDRFARVFPELSRAAGLLLVDWNLVSIVDTSTPELVLAWAARYHGP
jgi:hypothetical protein